MGPFFSWFSLMISAILISVRPRKSGKLLYKLLCQFVKQSKVVTEKTSNSTLTEHDTIIKVAYDDQGNLGVFFAIACTGERTWDMYCSYIVNNYPI